MKITTKDIARLAGVSRGTVDRALNNRPGITSITKEKVLKVARELSYRPNMVARSLVKGQTMSIGVVVFDLYNRFFAQLLNTLELKARDLGYFTYVTLTEKDPDVEYECLSNLADRNVDGIILFSVNKGKAYDEFLKSLQIPIVTVGNFVSKNWIFIGANDSQCMKDAVQNVLNCGYNQLIYVSPPLVNRDKVNMHTLEQRLKGFIKGCEESNIKDLDYIIIQQQDYKDELDHFCHQNSFKTAIMCSSDIYALEILIHLESKGIRVPDDVGLMGFDNIDILKYVKPSLTTVSYPIENIAIQAVNTLVKCIKGEKVPMSSILDYTINMRDSI